MKWFGLAPALLALACSSPTPGDDERAPLGKADNIGSCAAAAGGDLCGGPSDGTCFCDDACQTYGDCCGDFAAVCQADALCRQTITVQDTQTGALHYETWQDIDARGSLVREGGNAGPTITAPYQNFYDDRDRLVLVTSDWDSDGEKDYRRELRYDSSDRVTFEALDVLDFHSGQVVASRRRTSTYDAEGNPIAVSDTISGEELTYERSYTGMEEPGVATLTRERSGGQLVREIEVLYDHAPFGEAFKIVKTRHVDAGSTFVHEYHRGGQGMPYRLQNIYHYWPQNTSGEPDLTKRFTYAGDVLHEVVYSYAEPQGNDLHGKVLRFSFSAGNELAAIEDMQEGRRLSISYAGCTAPQVGALSPDAIDYVTGGF